MKNNRKQKILIVESDTAVAQMERKKLEEAGFITEIAGCGKDALKLLEGDKISLMLLNHKLPDMPGSEVIVALGEHICLLPIVIVAAYGDEHLVSEMLQSGATDYIVKDADLKFIQLLPWIVKNHIEHKLIEESLRKSERRLKQAEEISSLGHWEFNLISNTLYWSDETYRIFNLKPQEFEASYDAFLEVVHPEDREFVDKTYNDSLKNKTAYDIVHRLLLKDGTIKYVNEKCKTEYDENEKPLRSLGIVQDITERRKVEEKLEESENKFRDLVKFAPDSILIVDSDNRIIIANDQTEKVYGYTIDELIGQSHDILLPERFRQIHDKHRNNYLSKPHAREMGASLDLVCRHKDGSEIPVEISLSPLITNEGEQVICVTRDITERKQADLKHKKSEERYRLLTRSISDYAIFMITPDGIVNSWNEGVQKIKGYSPDEIIGKHFSVFYPEEDVKKGKIEHELQKAREDGRCEDEGWRIKKDGSRFLAKVIITALYDDSGELYGYAKVTSDITEQKQAEEVLQQKVQELTALSRLSQQVSSSLSLGQVVSAALDEVTTALSPDLTLFFLKDGDNLILQGMRSADPKYRHDETPVHRVGECLCGLSVSKGIPMYSSDILNDTRCTWEECKKADLRSFAALPLFGKDEIIGALGLASGTKREFEKQSVFLQTLTNDISTGLQNAILHMQVQKHAEELESRVAERTDELARANTRLKELDHLKSMFIASMSHELRTPLNSIMGFTGIILQGMVGKISDEQRTQLTMVKNSATHLLSLINDIIDISKIEAGKVEIYIHKFELQTAVKEVINSFTVLADEKNLKMDLKIPKKIMIESDERRIKQILVNFISNAIKFTEQGSVNVCVLQNSDTAIEISVADTGIGIKKEDMDKLFKAFSRIPIEGVIKEGTGLGLYLSRKISELLGCEIMAESEFGKGSIFTLTLPLRCT